MSSEFVPSDLEMLDLLRKRNSVTIVELSELMGVTQTAVRQRLDRLRAQGYVERRSVKEGRGRPKHWYGLTAKGRRKTGANFADLAIALWQEIRAIKDPEIRKGLLVRISKRLAEGYLDSVSGETLEDRMQSVVELFAERRIPFSVDEDGQLPVLTAWACPYPELAEQDRSICAVERILISELVGQQVHLGQCRLDGTSCCTFELN